MLKKLLISTAAAATMAGSALAADLPSYKAPPPPPPLPVFTWTGFYIGINGGYFDRQGTHVVGNPGAVNLAVAGAVPGVLTSSTAATFDSRRTHGGLAGGQIGYNWQANQYVVLGVEADADGAFGNSCGGFGNNNGGGGFFGNGNNCGVVNTLPVPGFPGVAISSTNSVSERLDFLATARGRFGVLPLPNVMVYATGGVAFGNSNSNVSVFQQVIGAAIPPAGTTFSTCGNNGLFGGNGNNGNCFRVGPTAGFGVEWMFLPGWSVKAEALYYDLRPVRTTTQFTTFAVGGVVPFFNTGLTAESRARGVIARAGINYHFTWGAPAPVVARY
jgi:outer membrane immunogenic protein